MKHRHSALATSIAGTLLLAAQVASADSFRSEVGASFVSGEACVGGSGYTPPEEYMIPTDPPPTGTPADPPVTGTPPPALPPTESLSGCVEDFDGFAVSGGFFLGAVDTSRGPLALAPFLSRASSLEAGYGRFEASDSDTDIDRWNLGGRFVIAEGLVLEASYEESEFDGDFNAIDVERARLGAGYYLGQDSQLMLSYTDEDADFAESERWAIDITHVQHLENGMTWSVNALYGWVTGDSVGADNDGSDILLAGEWFFRDDISVGADLEFVDRDLTGDLFAWTVQGTWFVTEKISLNLAYRNEDFDQLDADADAVEFEARYRF